VQGIALLDNRTGFEPILRRARADGVKLPTTLQQAWPDASFVIFARRPPPPALRRQVIALTS
jgi:hypothetical protein